MARNIPKILQNGLVMWLDWAGKDLSGNGNNWTLVNTPTKVRRLQNDGLSYNGSSQRTTFTAPTLWTTLTLSFWLSYDGAGTGEQQSVMLWGTSGNKATCVRLSGGNLQYLNSNFSAWVWGAFTFTTGKLYHIVVVMDASGGRMYKDTVQWASDAGTTTLAGTQWSAIASNGNAAQDYWNGKIINPMVWNRALSATEIDLLHKSTFIK